MRRYTDKHNNFGVIWSARTTNFHIELRAIETYGYRYDGDDDDGSIQAALDCGELVAFDTELSVYYGATLLAETTLGSSVYKDGQVAEFIRDGYFRDMLAEVCKQARESRPQLRKI